MKLLGKTLAITAAAFALVASTQSTFAQGQRGGGNFDRAEMQKLRETRMRELFDVKDDAEWKLIYERVEKVDEARRSSFGGGGMGLLMRRPGGENRGGGDNNNGGGRRGGGGGMFGGTPNPDQDALEKAVDEKASTEDIKAKVAKVREARKASEAKLEAAQAELKKVLTVRQEGVAVALGLLK